MTEKASHDLLNHLLYCLAAAGTTAHRAEYGQLHILMSGLSIMEETSHAGTSA